MCNKEEKKKETRKMSLTTSCIRLFHFTQSCSHYWHNNYRISTISSQIIAIVDCFKLLFTICLCCIKHKFSSKIHFKCLNFMSAIMVNTSDYIQVNSIYVLMCDDWMDTDCGRSRWRPRRSDRDLMWCPVPGRVDWFRP